MKMKLNFPTGSCVNTLQEYLSISPIALSFWWSDNKIPVLIRNYLNKLQVFTICEASKVNKANEIGSRSDMLPWWPLASFCWLLLEPYCGCLLLYIFKWKENWETWLTFTMGIARPLHFAMKQLTSSLHTFKHAQNDQCYGWQMYGWNRATKKNRSLSLLSECAVTPVYSYTAWLRMWYCVEQWAGWGEVCIELKCERAPPSRPTSAHAQDAAKKGPQKCFDPCMWKFRY